MKEVKTKELSLLSKYMQSCDNFRHSVNMWSAGG